MFRALEPRSSPRRLPPLACVLDALPVTLPVARGRATAVSSASALGNGQSATASPGPSSSSTWNCVHVHIVHFRLQSSAAYFLARRTAIRFIKEAFDASNFFTGASSSAGDLGIYHAGGSVLKAIRLHGEQNFVVRWFSSEYRALQLGTRTEHPSNDTHHDVARLLPEIDSHAASYDDACDA